MRRPELVFGRTSLSGSESTRTVLIALGANLLVAVAKSVAALITGSASVLAEAAHSWADTGNEALLMVANHRSQRAPDEAHPFGHGREAYIWSLLAAIGLFVAGAAVSITHGVQELIHPAPADDYVVGYIVLVVSFVFEGISFWQSIRQARRDGWRCTRSTRPSRTSAATEIGIWATMAAH